ncbi:YwiC-like family protein [Vulgatibacter sp.]|uniref:YwiC-like family protein n=1 Tax=Vulgatibacter sp. TaxID=1971226 RepID=UPI0035662175
MSQAELTTHRPLVTAPPLPREHGAWIGLGTACLVGLLAGGTPDLHSIVAGAAALAFFAAKASAEHFAIGLRPERATFWLTAFVGAGGILLAALGDRIPHGGAPVALVAAMAALFAHGAARAGRAHRALVWEAVGFFGIGGAAALVALVQGAAPGRAIALWLLVGAHLAATVPFVRLRVRPAEKRARFAAASVLAQAGAMLAAGAVVGAGLASPRIAFAFLPALVKIGRVLLRHEGPQPAKRVGLEETGWTLLFAVLLAALA